jgi:hypothetical protein
VKRFLTALLSSAMIVVLGAEAPAASNAAQVQPGSFLRPADFRVANVAYRLAVAGRQHCQALLPLTGISLHYLPEYDVANRSEAARLYGVDRGPGVLSVIGDSPAQRAGLLAGDVLLAINGLPLPSGREMAGAADVKTWRRAVEQVEAHLETQLQAGPARLSVLRKGIELDLPLDRVMGCPIRSRLARSSQANAFANERTVIMTTRLLDFVRNDDELAVVIAHEAAHNILGHPARLEAEKVPKGLLANFGKNATRVRRTEEEADRLGLKLLWSAGYDPSAVLPFWRRLYQAFDPVPTPKLFNRHPSLAARERIVAETLAELSRSGVPSRP